ncbi:MAG: hypothetical protein JSW21_02405 [Gammaproteobacteria bacterium]|nr:MAG: hypothetical protein JSW21_02405 [Gammaproteobacteria bacterium]
MKILCNKPPWLIQVLIVMGLSTSAAVAQVAEPVPFECTGEGFLVQENPASLYQINQSVNPFTFDLIAGPFTTQLNNLGYRSGENVLYAMELNLTGQTLGNSGIVKIDSNGTVFPVATTGVSIPPGIRYAAGDVSPDGNWFYISSQTQDGVTTQGDSTLFIVDLDTLVVTSVERVNSSGVSLNVADWAAHPTEKAADGMQPVLYGATFQGNVLRLDPSTGTVTRVGASAVLPAGIQQPGNAYGGAFFDAAGQFFAYRNGGPTVGDRPGEIYQVDLAVPQVVSAQFGGPSSTFNDTAACAAEPEDPAGPAIDLQKSVCLGGLGSLECASAADGSEFVTGMYGDLVTYFFVATNTGDVDLDLSMLSDTVLGIVGDDLIPMLSTITTPLAPGDSVEFAYEATIDSTLFGGGSLINQACVVAFTDEAIPQEVSDCDTAIVLAPDLCEGGGPMYEGCTPGFWRGSLSTWGPTGLNPGDDFDTTFGVEFFSSDKTLEETINLGGGGTRKLARHGTAGLLNALHPDVDYSYTPEEVIDIVQGDTSVGVVNDLVSANELSGTCPAK